MNTKNPIKEYSANFIGRKVGAIGGLISIHTHTKGINPKEAILSLYDYWEHIEKLVLTDIKTGDCYDLNENKLT